MKFLKTISLYYLIIIFLLSLYFLGTYSFGLQKVLWQAGPAVLAAITTDAILRYLKLRRWFISISALISGLIIGLVAQFGEKTWILAVIAVSAMLIKFVIRWDSRHIFNPAASGLFIGSLFLNSLPSWWVGGQNFWIFIIWIPILLIKQRRWAPMVGFLVPLVIINGLNILTSASLLFFLSVMLIEPKTSSSDTKIGLFYGLIVAIGYFLLSNFISGEISRHLDPLILSLLIGNLGARLLQKFLV